MNSKVPCLYLNNADLQDKIRSTQEILKPGASTYLFTIQFAQFESTANKISNTQVPKQSKGRTI